MWTLPKIKDGLEKFFKENNHYPTAYEIDSCPYLPSARSIQRGFGGLEKVREELGLKVTHYGKGATRSKKAYDVGIRGKNIENEVEPVLVSKFGEIFVHTQKRINNISADFFVYNPDENFGVDVFCFENTKDFSNIINHKQKIYSDYAFRIILLAIGEKEEFPQTQIDKLVNNKKILLSDKFMVMNLSSLKEWISGFSVYTTPIIAK